MTADSDLAEHEDDQEDWHLEILQALVVPSTAEDAALACAAAWMNFGRMQRVAVCLFINPTTCVIAHGQIDGGHLTVYVGEKNTPMTSLLNAESLCGPSGPCDVDDPDLTLCWPEHLSAVFIKGDIDRQSDERLELLQTLSRTVLSRWTMPHTSFACPDRMEALAEFAAGAGHEINNPLGSIIGQTQLLLKKQKDPEQQQALETIGAQAWRVRDMIGDTMLFARPPQPEFQDCDLSTIASEVIDRLQLSDVSNAQSIRMSIPEASVRLVADPVQISRLLSELLRNACRATTESSTDADVHLQIAQDRSAVVVTIADSGPKMSPTVRRHLFDPFFSGRQAGRGLGFGLCHCWQIARMHNGLLTHQAVPGGNHFVVLLPAK